MNFYQTEGSSRTIRIALIGAVGLFAVGFVVIKQALAITILSLVPIAIVVLGLLTPRRKTLVAVLPPVSDAHPSFAADGISAQPYPQAVLYGIAFRSLYLLLIPIGISGLTFALVASGVVKDYADNPLPLYGSLIAVFVATISGLRWLNECRLMARVLGGYALVKDRAILLLGAPESQPVGVLPSALRYHRFKVVDVKHVTEEQLSAASGQ